MPRTIKFKIYRYDPDKDAKPYMQDLTVTLQDEPLPRNANGKVVKRTLRETLLAEPTLRGTTA